MNEPNDPIDTSRQAFLGSLIADAVAMPVHWYYDRDALDRDVAGALRQLGIPGVESRPVLARCEPERDATYETRLLQVLPLFARGRKVSFVPGVATVKLPT